MAHKHRPRSRSLSTVRKKASSFLTKTFIKYKMCRNSSRHLTHFVHTMCNGIAFYFFVSSLSIRFSPSRRRRLSYKTSQFISTRYILYNTMCNDTKYFLFRRSLNSILTIATTLQTFIVTYKTSQFILQCVHIHRRFL